MVLVRIQINRIQNIEREQLRPISQQCSRTTIEESLICIICGISITLQFFSEPENNNFEY